jgi:tetratricopeptide (TPR) repeat protein
LRLLPGRAKTRQLGDLYRPLVSNLRESVGESLEVVFDGMGSLVTPAMPVTKAKDARDRYAVLLQSSVDPGEPLKASIPAILQEAQVFTSSRVSDGKTHYQTSLGYFATLAEAENAQRMLVQRFPAAAVVPLIDRASPPPPSAATPPSDPGITTTQATTSTVIASAPEVEARATQLMAVADAANDRGDYADAIAALDSLLNMPPNTRSRKAQEQIGITRLKAGDNARARGEFENFLKLYPTGADSDQVRQYLVNLPAAAPVAKGRGATEPVSTINGSVSAFYYGGQSQTRSQDFVDSPLGGCPFCSPRTICRA